MRSLSSELQAHLEGSTITLCTCWKLSLTNDTVIGFTDHSNDLVIDAVTYYSSSGYVPSAVNYNSTMEVSNLDISGLLSTGGVTRADIEAGLFDFAKVEIFMVNYMDLTMGELILKKGKFGEVEIHNEDFMVELRSLTESLTTSSICDIYSPQCRAIFGDAKCGINLASITVSGTITSVTDSTHYTTSGLGSYSNDYFNYGLITFTSGANVGMSNEVKDFTQSSGIVTTYLPYPYSVSVGDTFTIYPGCDRDYTTCSTRYNNIVNFRGEPFLPGTAKMLEYAQGSKTYETSYS